jgi:myo-inositol-1(or 4)-monophosphatase
MDHEMTDTDLAARFAVAEKLAREAGAMALEYFRQGVVTEYKTAHATVSEADRSVEEFLRRELLERFPTDTFFGEETGGDGADADAGVWVVDPIDGTDCFVHGIPTWCVSVAYLRGRTIELGIIYDPNADELFSARRGHGAHMNGNPIRASDATDLGHGVVGMGYSLRRAPGEFLEVLTRFLDAGGMFQRTGSGALMLTYVGAGRMLGFYEAHLNSWDAVAALAIAQEGGAWCNDFLAGDFLTGGNPIAVAAPGIVGEFQRITGLS